MPLQGAFERVFYGNSFDGSFRRQRWPFSFACLHSDILRYYHTRFVSKHSPPSQIKKIDRPTNVRRSWNCATRARIIGEYENPNFGVLLCFMCHDAASFINKFAVQWSFLCDAFWVCALLFAESLFERFYEPNKLKPEWTVLQSVCYCCLIYEPCPPCLQVIKFSRFKLQDQRRTPPGGCLLL